MKPTFNYAQKLQSEVIRAGLCTQCGTCVGLQPDQFIAQDSARGPVPQLASHKAVSNAVVYQACPGKGVAYRELNHFVFGHEPPSMLLGNYQQAYVGYAQDAQIRRQGASAGVLTALLVFLLEHQLIEGAIVLEHGKPKPWLARPIIATSKAQILASAQSVYIPVMTNAILAKVKTFQGRLAMVGLPDQVASIRQLQRLNNPIAKKITYLVGPYVGTALYPEAILSFLRTHGVEELEQIKRLRYRDGPWPGHLRIDLKDGRTLTAAKFYYNYLIPFYITKPSLMSVDFTNELTDISVGDAWSPVYEAQSQGYSVVLGRTKLGTDLLKLLIKKQWLLLEKQSETEVIAMHAHMLDFKKRGTFIRLKWLRAMGKSTPSYDYDPVQIPFSRYVVEIIISGLFVVGRWPMVRWLVEQLSIEVMGGVFNFLRLYWKKMSKTTKRDGLAQTTFQWKHPL